MHPLILLADVVAISVLTFGIYYPRHRRRDMVTAYLGVNAGALAVAGTLATAQVGVGLGLGLFGVLSIIRLRSVELDQAAVAYYFGALALGLLGGLGLTDPALTVGLMGLIVAALFLGDHPRLLPGARTQVIHLDRAFLDETALTAHLERLLGARVRRAEVRRLDLVGDTTLVEVSFDAARTSTPSSPRREPAPAGRRPDAAVAPGQVA